MITIPIKNVPQVSVLFMLGFIESHVSEGILVFCRPHKTYSSDSTLSVKCLTFLITFKAKVERFERDESPPFKKNVLEGIALIVLVTLIRNKNEFQ